MQTAVFMGIKLVVLYAIVALALALRFPKKLGKVGWVRAKLAKLKIAVTWARK